VIIVHLLFVHHCSNLLVVKCFEIFLLVLLVVCLGVFHLALLLYLLASLSLCCAFKLNLFMQAGLQMCPDSETIKTKLKELEQIQQPQQPSPMPASTSCGLLQRFCGYLTPFSFGYLMCPFRPCFLIR
jgi:hypothetical protein